VTNEREFLPAEDVADLAGCSARDAQCAALDAAGIPYIRQGKRILVSRAHVRQRLLGEQLRQSAGPRLDLVR
jgi:hypothetical protein